MASKITSPLPTKRIPASRSRPSRSTQKPYEFFSDDNFKLLHRFFRNDIKSVRVQPWIQSIIKGPRQSGGCHCFGKCPCGAQGGCFGQSCSYGNGCGVNGCD